MRLAIISHKVCWESAERPGEYLTDGGFPLQIKAISELFAETNVIIPCSESKPGKGVSKIEGLNLSVCPLKVPTSTGLKRKIGFPFWLLKNSKLIWRGVKHADAVHAPIPGDVGTIGMLYALVLRKPLFVRHCGNWLVQKTLAEHLWKRGMEYFAGGRNVMFATGGSPNPPSERNANIKWIFSTSLTKTQLEQASAKVLPNNGGIKLITACRLEPKKGVDVVLRSFPMILEKFPNSTLDVVGDGSLIGELKNLAQELKIDGQVKFHGKVEHSRVIELMQHSDLFCFPTSASEGFPKVVVEALACGLPIVTTNVSVLPQLIGKKCGVVLEEPTAKNVAKAVIDVCTNRKLFKDFSAQAITTAREYSLERWGKFIAENLRKAWGVDSLSSK